MVITVVGLGYVGLSNAVLLAQKNEVIAVDIQKEKISLINNKVCPFNDREIQNFLSTKDLNLVATVNYEDAFKKSDFIIISTPTDYDVETNFFDTSTVIKVIRSILKINNSATIIIKSTVPVGFTKDMKRKFNTKNIMFSPEFLREGKALYDNLYPSRIIVGEKSERALIFANLLCEGAKKQNIQVHLTNSTEAEAIKLFSNTYLALRVSFFNELDSYSEIENLNTKDIIYGVCLDSRIGDFYNNPSFGYGGYCLPKDTKQLVSNYGEIPQNIISAIVDSNETRKNHISNMIIQKSPKIVGIYRLTMKTDSDNFRHSAVQDIMQIIKNRGIEVIIYEPSILKTNFFEYKVVNNLETFKNISDIIVANRVTEEISDISSKVYSRDIFSRD